MEPRLRQNLRRAFAIARFPRAISETSPEKSCREVDINDAAASLMTAMVRRCDPLHDRGIYPP